MPTKSKTVSATALFTCYSCKRPASAGTNADGVEALVHELPTCKEFDAIETLADGVAYLKLCRIAALS
jgi:hypothetical protein